jgi:hypothetical protein
MMIGYASIVSEGVTVAMDQTTRLDHQMTIETINMEEIRIVATRPVDPGRPIILRKHLLAACAREGIDLPYPRQEVWLRGSQTMG